ncbi:GNAT family N-acetyltransferase [Ancylomarina euxinus]|uniref:GNAT family N-acetyltransferase n=1 Tax=Ancylomarina euxinus TaxID=2283627 RepID=A0A425Y273_9BACT|nr:GNAT family N-acetyltransferase [Ancylomarina euxinus]MCZ4694858.1 GNAT family N-acetyltransferase [Ancylomarina euxinus]MUP14724.1 GNAT family N-acetyltransferase [Ancylomarina euxinus]RRG22074.1 GNAT family N-acetyltransferase [Ancylomarina euxinus]
MQIRKAQTKDALNIVYLKTQVWLHTYATKGICSEYTEYLKDNFIPNKIKRKIEDKNKYCLIVEKDGFMIAYCEIDLKAVHPESKLPMPEMTAIYISEHFHGQGIGKSLLLEAEKQLFSRNQSSYWLSCFIENQNAIDFYNRMGFHSTSSIFFSMGNNEYENLVFDKEISIL